MNSCRTLEDESTVGDFIELPINKNFLKITPQHCIVEENCNIPSICWLAAKTNTSRIVIGE